MTWINLTLGVIALGVGIWLGLGAPGWPHKPSAGGSRRRGLEKRAINPIANWRRSESPRRHRRSR
jgi:hypothetical protein